MRNAPSTNRTQASKKSQLSICSNRTDSPNAEPNSKATISEAMSASPADAGTPTKIARLSVRS